MESGCAHAKPNGDVEGRKEKWRWWWRRMTVVVQHQRHNWDGIYPTQKTWSQKSLFLNEQKNHFNQINFLKSINVKDSWLIRWFLDEKVFALSLLSSSPRNYYTRVQMSCQSYLSHSQSHKSQIWKIVSLLFVEFTI